MMIFEIDHQAELADKQSRAMQDQIITDDQNTAAEQPGQLAPAHYQAAEPRIYYGYWLILAAFFAQFISIGVQNYVIGAFMTPMIDEFAWSRAEYTIPRTVGQVVMALTGFLIGSYVDRYGGRRFMLAGVVILVVALTALGEITSLWQWIALNGLGLPY